jgi:competence ComEA-like helix-hairpin-helix protein
VGPVFVFGTARPAPVWIAYINYMKLSVALALCLCASAATTLAFAAEDEDAKRLPTGPGRDTVAQSCLNCHTSAYFRRLRIDKDAWSEKVGDMMDRGAKITDAQAAIIVDYLSRTFGPGAKMNVNTAPYEELKAILSLTNPETQALMAARKEKGQFKSIDELKAVNGVDEKKIDAKKEMITF